VVPAAFERENDTTFEWAITERHEASSLNEIGPGYFCGLALERVGTRLLYQTKVFILAAKLFTYSSRVNGTSKLHRLRTAENLSLPNLGLMIQECVDIMCPSSEYPLFLPSKAVSVLLNVWWYDDFPQEEENIAKLIISLGYIFGRSDIPISVEIMSSMYTSIIRSPLHNHYDNAANKSIISLAMYLSHPSPEHYELTFAFENILSAVCGVRKLSLGELSAIKAYFEFWIQPANQWGLYPRTIRHLIPCFQQDTWFQSIYETLMDSLLTRFNAEIASFTHTDNDEQAGRFLYETVRALDVFLESSISSLDISRINIVHSITASLLSLLMTADDPPWSLLSSNSTAIRLILRFIARSPNLAYACAIVRSGNFMDILVGAILRCDVIKHSTREIVVVFECRTLSNDVNSLLSLIATPFVGLSGLENTHCLSVLKKYGWPGEGVTSDC